MMVLNNDDNFINYSGANNDATDDDNFKDAISTIIIIIF